MRVVLACIAAFVLCVGLASMRSAGGPPLAAQASPRWEYATLVQADSPRHLVLAMPDRTIDADSLPELLTKYGHRHARTDSIRQDVINTLGQDGWELVQISDERILDAREWWFKRPLH